MEDKSFVARGEKALDDFLRLWRRRKVACTVILICMAVPAAGFAIANFWGKGALNAEIDHMRRERDSVITERDSKAAQLAPFLALANQRFETAPPDKRLDLLLERVEELSRTVRDTAALLPRAQKSLDDTTLRRIQSKLDFARSANVHVSSLNGDAKAFEIARQLFALFQNSGFSVSGINSVITTEPVSGLRVTFGSEPSEVLRTAFAEIFAALEQTPAITVNPSATADIDILVASKR